MIKDSDRATRLPLWGLAYLNPPDPLFKGAIRACGLSIATRLPLLANSGPASDDALLNPANPIFKGAHQAFVRTRAHGHRFAVLRPASDDALLHLWTVLFRTGLFALFRGCPKHCRDVAVNFSNNLHADILWILLIVN